MPRVTHSEPGLPLVKPAVSLHKNAAIFSVRSATRNPCQALVTAYRNCKAMPVSICTAYCENSLQCSSSFKKGVALKESLNRRRKRDREPSRIPVKRILNVLRKKKKIEKRYSCLLDKLFQIVHLSLV